VDQAGISIFEYSVYFSEQCSRGVGIAATEIPMDAQGTILEKR
jgi:hypothetical protein